MTASALTDKSILEAFLQRDRAIHLYEIGDLDPFFWPHTTWHAWPNAEAPQAVALLYSGSSLPTLLVFERAAPGAASQLLHSLCQLLPPVFHAHLSPGLERVLTDFEVIPHGEHDKMVLADPDRLAEVDTSGTEPLAPSHEAELVDFYSQSYPGNWFMPRMLETGQYFATRDDGQLSAVAGVHVYSAAYKVAALGNITTKPDYRGRGLATVVTARLCQSLLATVDTIGLNVKADNSHAIRCYQRLGFETVAQYGEFAVRRR